jgi:hypothetical protein
MTDSLVRVVGAMPKEGHTTVTVETYRWDEVKEYFEAHKKQLRKKGIKSASALFSYWVSLKLREASSTENQ